jgi:hypothetical protein
LALGFRLQGLGFRKGGGSRVEDLGFRVQGFGFLDLRLIVAGFRYKVQGLRFSV